MWTKRVEHLNTSRSLMWNFSLTFFLKHLSRGQKYHLELNEPLPLCGVAKPRLLFSWNFNGWFSVPKELTAVTDNVY